MSLYRQTLDKILVRQNPVITKYDIWVAFWSTFAEGSASNPQARIRRPYPNENDVAQFIKRTLAARDLDRDRDFSENVFRIIDTTDQSAEELCCYVDPFACISRISAMQHWGLTNRHPSALHLTTYAPAEWKRRAMEKMLGEAQSISEDMPISDAVQLEQYVLPNKVRGRAVVLHKTKHLFETTNLRSPNARIATIGQSFLDMLTDPQDCGGMPHVLDVWREHAKDYLEDILISVDACKTKIAKVRAGYILDDLLGIADKRIDNWVILAQRGGSRVLDPSKPYRPSWSEKWQISLNN